MERRNMFIIGILYCKYVILPNWSTDSTQSKSRVYDVHMEVEKLILNLDWNAKGQI